MPNLKKLPAIAVNKDAGSHPYLMSIGELAQKVVEQYENPQLSTEEALRKFGELAQTVFDAEAERADLDITENACVVYVTLK